jgi:Secretion system C-terminal sorting domain
MKKYQLYILVLTLLYAVSAAAQFKPTIGFEELMISTEKNFNQVLEARKLAEMYDLPHTIYLPEGVFIEAKGVENNQVVYSIINDLIHPFNRGEVAFWEEVDARFDLSEARIHRSNKPTQNPKLGYNFTEQQNMAVSFIMVLESTNDAVMTFNYNDGSLINPAFIPGGNPNLSTPIEPLLTPNATILVSDQLTDNIVEFDTLGAFIRIFFGGNTAVLDNCRGIELRPGNTSLVAAIAGTTNQDAIAEFDLTTGNYLGNFIAPNAAQMDGPWDIVFRTTDCLVTGEASDNVVKYDLSGNYIGNFFSPLNFPEQLNKTTSGNIIVAVFSSPSGLYVFDPNGAQLNYFSTVTGLRGCIQLGDGNYLVTNGTGVYVLDQNTGAILATPVSGVSGRSAHEYDLSIVPVELTSFSANVADRSVLLNWTTATEVNNQGFEIERSEDGISFSNIGFVPGFGTTTEPKSYSYTDQSINSGKYYYRLQQIDYNGSFNYSNVVEVEVSLPTEFSLEQNYPNPFNPLTSIQFSLPVDAQVTIGVYNLVGEKVDEVVNKDFSTGSHKVNFNASTLTSGIYFYQIDATGNNGKTFTSVKKMTLLK